MDHGYYWFREKKWHAGRWEVCYVTGGYVNFFGLEEIGNEYLTKHVEFGQPVVSQERDKFDTIAGKWLHGILRHFSWDRLEFHTHGIVLPPDLEGKVKLVAKELKDAGLGWEELC